MKKNCTGCGEEKELSNFHKSKTCRYGVKARCKDCEKQRTADRKNGIQRKANKTKVKKERKGIRMIFSFLLLATMTSAQCEFPKNSSSQIYQDAILYFGKIYATPHQGGIVLSAEPNKLRLKRTTTSAHLLDHRQGTFMIKWHYALRPNRWQPYLTDCEAWSLNIKNTTGQTVLPAFIEVDFFWQSFDGRQAATFEGTLLLDQSQVVVEKAKAQALSPLPVNSN